MRLQLERTEAGAAQADLAVEAAAKQASFLEQQVLSRLDLGGARLIDVQHELARVDQQVLAVLAELDAAGPTRPPSKPTRRRVPFDLVKTLHRMGFRSFTEAAEALAKGETARKLVAAVHGERAAARADKGALKRYVKKVEGWLGTLQPDEVDASLSGGAS